MKKFALLITLISSLSFSAYANTCSSQFESDLARQNDAVAAKVAMLSLTIFAFPVGLSATSVEAKNQFTLRDQAVAFRVIKEAYAGSGPHLDQLLDVVEDKIGQEVDEDEVIDIVLEADKRAFCRKFPWPTRQLGYMTVSELIEHTVAKL